MTQKLSPIIVLPGDVVIQVLDYLVRETQPGPHSMTSIAEYCRKSPDVIQPVLNELDRVRLVLSFCEHQNYLVSNIGRNLLTSDLEKMAAEARINQ